MVPEASLEPTEHGLIPGGGGWFVVGAREARWRERAGTGRLCDFAGGREFAQLGITIRVVVPGEPITIYHWEADQEDSSCCAARRCC